MSVYVYRVRSLPLATQSVFEKESLPKSKSHSFRFGWKPQWSSCHPVLPSLELGAQAPCDSQIAMWMRYLNPSPQDYRVNTFNCGDLSPAPDLSGQGLIWSLEWL